MFVISLVAAATASAQTGTATRVQPPGFAFVALKVKDMPAAQHFYETQLGLTEQFRNDTAKQLELGLDFPSGGAVGSRLLLILDKDHKGPLAAGERLSRIAFYVADVDATCQRLKAADPKIGCQPVNNATFKVKVAFTQDPDGNRVELLQPYD